MSDSLLANRFRILHPLGEGAMGMVWAVEDTTTGAVVALKVISKNYGATAKSILQFKQEFRLMTQMRHPNCCAVYDYGLLADGEPYFTMEVVPGKGLDELAPMSGAEARAVLSQLLLALGYVHQLGFVHRDLKSANVRVTPDGAVKLMDFGLMDFAGRVSGAIAGTMGYLAPEVIKRGPVDARADLYAVGCLAYEILTGRLPFASALSREVIMGHLQEAPEPPSNHAPVDAALEAVVLRLLAKDPLERFQSAAEVLEALGAEAPAGLGGTLLASPMVGREEALGVLENRLTAIAERRATATLAVVGPSGVGKTRLLTEFRHRVQLENVPLAVGQAQASPTPYGPIVAVLRQLLPAMKAHAQAALERHAPVLGELLPELEAPGAARLESPNAEKLRLHAAMAEVLTALAEATGLVVILEDWHQADPLSIEALGFVCRNSAESPVFFALSSTSPVVAQETCDLRPLDVKGVRRMAASMLGAEADAAFVAQLHALTGGSPRHVEELLDHLVRTGVLMRQAGRWNQDVSLEEASLGALLRERLGALPAQALRLGRAAAAAGRAVALELLQRASGLVDADFFEALERLQREGVLVADDDGAYTFAKEDVRLMISAGMSDAERAEWHLALATALEAIEGHKPPEALSREAVVAIAGHYLETDRTDKIVPYALEAGLRSAALFANAEAERFLGAGLAIVRAGVGDEAVRERYLRGLADVKRVVGAPEAASALYDEAIPLARKLGAGLWLGRMLTSKAKALQMLGDPADALAACMASLTACRAAKDAAGASRCLITSSRIRFFQGDMPGALADAESGLVEARASGDAGKIGEATAFLGYLTASSAPERAAEGIERMREGLSLLREVGDLLTLNSSLILLGDVLSGLGSYEEARAAFEEGRRLGAAVANKPEYVVTLVNLAMIDLEQGAFAEVAVRGAEIRALAAELKNHFFEGLSAAVEASALAYGGRYAEARQRSDRAIAAARELKNKYLEGILGQHALDAALLSGDLPGARTLLETLEPLARESGNTRLRVRLEALAAELLAREDRLDEAESRLARALAEVAALRARGTELRVLRTRAWLSLHRERWDEAESAAKKALAGAEDLGARYVAAELHGILGELALKTEKGDPQAHFEAMRQAAESMDSRLLSALALFGLAASRPYASEAQELVARAQALLAELAAGLDSAGAERFYALKERRRVRLGNHIEFSLPTSRKRGTGPLAARFGMGGLGL